MHRFFVINGVSYDEEKFEDKLLAEVNKYAEANFDATLNESEGGEVVLCGATYDLSTVLYKTDPIFYQALLQDYATSLLNDFKRELERGEHVKLPDMDFCILEGED